MIHAHPSATEIVEKELEPEVAENVPTEDAETNNGDAHGAAAVDGRAEEPTSTSKDATKPSRRQILDEAMKRLRQVYINAKRSYRIAPERLNRIQRTLNLFIGTRNHHNYTIQKTFNDPSAKRVIKSFDVNKTPILIDGTEWLSMKVHGQSFMMHQIRKMVGMVALVVRCGCDPERLREAMGPERLSIPKAPSLGLLLERPSFDSYNKVSSLGLQVKESFSTWSVPWSANNANGNSQRAKDTLSKGPIDFDRFRTEMDKFKQEQIYERMYRDEEKENVFGNFFNHVDNFPSETFLFVTSGGFEATQTSPLVGAVPKGEEKNKIENALVEKDVDIDADDGDSDVDEVKDDHGHEG